MPLSSPISRSAIASRQTRKASSCPAGPPPRARLLPSHATSPTRPSAAIRGVGRAGFLEVADERGTVLRTPIGYPALEVAGKDPVRWKEESQPLSRAGR